MKFLARLLPFSAFAPLLALAQSAPTNAGQLTEVETFLNNIVNFVNFTLVPLVFAIAFLVFIYGIFSYFILGSDDEGKRETGRTYMLYGIIGFVVMVSVWGIVNIIATGLGLDVEQIQNIPDVMLSNP